ncbi:AfsR/SARP family transcriptional regulator [Actinomadura oligospora]|uniref:AfsR/SARP family transcriptional regulator n=1 Tax=Actinomadura oligospora TaxID=111804 RepID=UPI0004AE5D68|nr:BTAD domain-containing putative transcriptional regulator [Actinomadura oligospora]
METPTEPLRFRLLGPPLGRRGDTDLDLGSPQQRALLAVLLLREGAPVSAPELVSAVWDGDPPPRALGTLRTYASRLRRLFEPGRIAGGASEVLVTVGSGYALRVPSEATDTLRFTRLVAEAERAEANGAHARARELLIDALGLWRGEAFAGIPGPFAEAQRVRLTERLVAAQVAKLDLDIRLGNHAEAVDELRRLIAAYPLRERPRELLMLALYRAGRRAEALDVYLDTRRALVDELGIEPGLALTALHQQVLAASSPTPATSARPAQLPGAVADFTGRAVQVDELRRALAETGVATVAGVAGVGKSALALRVAHLLRADHPDGQLFADLHGAHEHPADPHLVLGAFLKALGVATDAVPNDLGDRTALLRRVLTGRRVLMVLDDARDADQVRPLLPRTSGSTVIVTGRARLDALPAAHPVDLDVFAPDESRELLVRIVGPDRIAAEPDAARDLLEACGHLPLAVRVAAARLAARPCWTVRSLVDRLADRRRRLAELRVADLAVEPVFQLGYNQLRPALRRAFRLLALPDGPSFSVEAAAAVLAVPAVRAAELCRALERVSLLRSPVPGQYRYHDLLRLYARQRAEADEPAAERAAALRRLVDFCLATTRAAHLAVNPGDGRAHASGSSGASFPDPEAARDWLSAEAPGLLAVIAQAARAGLTGPAADLLLLTDALVVSGFHARACEQAAHAVIDASSQRRDRRAEGRAHLLLGWLHYYANRIADAEAVCRIALDRARETGDTWTAADALSRLGNCAYLRGRHEEALGFDREALAAFRAHGDRHGEGVTLAAMGRALLDVGHADEAVEAVTAGLALHRELGGVYGIGYALYQAGVVLRDVRGHAEVLAMHVEALERFRSGGYRVWEGLSLFRVAHARLDLGDTEAAEEDARRALTVLREVGDPWGQAMALDALARSLAARGHTAVARTHWTEALRIFEDQALPEADAIRAHLAR